MRRRRSHMKTPLILAEHPALAETVREGLNPEQYRIIHRSTLEEAEPFLVHGLADCCILDLDLTTVQGLWSVEKVRRRAPKCPVLIYAGAKQWEWEEEAYLQGATHVLSKPVRPRLLAALLERLWPAAASAPSLPAVPPAPPIAVPAAVVSAPAASQTLTVLRDVSSILSHSLNTEAM